MKKDLFDFRSFGVRIFDFLDDYEASLKNELDSFSSKPSDFYVACVGGEFMCIDRIRNFVKENLKDE